MLITYHPISVRVVVKRPENLKKDFHKHAALALAKAMLANGHIDISDGLRSANSDDIYIIYWVQSFKKQGELP